MSAPPSFFRNSLTKFPARSLTIGEAEVWYREMVPKIEGMLDKTTPAHIQARQAWQLREQLRSAAQVALFDQGLAVRFAARHPIPSQSAIEKLLISGADGLSGKHQTGQG